MGEYWPFVFDLHLTHSHLNCWIGQYKSCHFPLAYVWESMFQWWPSSDCLVRWEDIKKEVGLFLTLMIRNPTILNAMDREFGLEYWLIGIYKIVWGIFSCLNAYLFWREMLDFVCSTVHQIPRTRVCCWFVTLRTFLFNCYSSTAFGIEAKQNNNDNFCDTGEALLDNLLVEQLFPVNWLYTWRVPIAIVALDKTNTSTFCFDFASGRFNGDCLSTQ